MRKYTECCILLYTYRKTRGSIGSYHGEKIQMEELLSIFNCILIFIFILFI